MKNFKEFDIEQSINELSSDMLQSYKEKAKKSADDLSAKGNHKKSLDRTMSRMRANGKQIDKTTAEIKKSLKNEETDKGEYDYEGQMARTQLQTTMRNCEDLIDMLDDDENMPEWVQSKITLAQDYITTVRDYLQSTKELGEEVVAEALDTHEMAMAHKDKASKALETSDMKSFHNHMSNHHESMGQWHESKGRHSAADREYAKAEEHHKKSLKPDNSRTVGAKNESTICSVCQSDPCICDDSHGFVAEAAQAKHRVSVTVSEKDHPMISKRLEKQQKFVKVSADSKEEAVSRAKKFYTKQGYHVHSAEHHSVSESAIPSFKDFIE